MQIVGFPIGQLNYNLNWEGYSALKVSGFDTKILVKNLFDLAI